MSDQETASPRTTPGVRPLRLVHDGRPEVLESAEAGREDFRAAHSPAVAVVTPDDVIAHLDARPTMKLPARKLVLDFAAARDVMQILDEVSGAAAAIELPASTAQDLAMRASSTPAAAREGVRALAADLAAGLTGARNLVRAVDLAIDLAVDLACGLPDRVLARALADARTSARCLDQSLALDHVLTRDLGRDLQRNRPVPLDRPAYAEIDRDGDRGYLRRLADSITFARDAAAGVGDALARDLVQMFLPIGRLDLDRLDDDADALRQAVNDLRGADLSRIDLVGVDLEGVRWSASTRWPDGWREQITQDSVLIGDGLFEVRPEPRVRS